MSHSGWSNDQPLILTLPGGATSGARIVIDGTRDAIFVYDASNNLAESLAAAAGNDGHGNTYQAGYTCYYVGDKPFWNVSPTNMTMSNFAQTSSWSLTSALPLGDFIFTGASVAGVAGSALQLALNPTGTQLNWLMSNITAFAPGGIGTFTAETWHTLPLTAGFQQLATFGLPRYRLEPIDAGTVRLSGFLQLVGNQAQNTAIATLPAAYRPTVNRYFLTANNLSGATGQIESIRIAPTGIVSTGNAGSNTNYIGLDGITFEID